MRQINTILLLLLLAGCDTGPASMAKKGLPWTTESFSRFGWLEGNWANSSGDLRFCEQWQQRTKQLYTGQSWATAGKDTVFFEQVSLMLADSGIYYSVTVKNQNKGETVSFRYKGDSAGVAVFGNENHDFPQRICYSHPHPDSLVAWIEGRMNGNFSRETFRMARTK